MTVACQEIANPLPSRPDGRSIAAHQARTPDIALLHVRRRHNERIAVPFAGREPAPRVRRMLRRVRASIHPDRGLLLQLVDVTTMRDHLLGCGVHFRPDVQHRQNAFERKIPGMRPGHPFGDVEFLGRPAVGPPSTCLADRKTSGIAGHPTAILVASKRAPSAGDVRLREERETRKEQKNEDRDQHGPAKAGHYVQSSTIIAHP